MGNRYRIYCTVFWVLISMSLIACGNGDMNFNDGNPSPTSSREETAPGFAWRG
jgi:hypothetical protein